MFAGFVKIIKRHTPRVHGLIKRIHQRSGLPALKRLNGRFTLVAPNLLGTYPTEPHVLKWIDELLGPGDIFLDVGAHYGWMSMVACRSVGPTGKVIAFEPSPPLVRCLQYNKKANRLHQMEIVSKAVVDRGGRMLPFYVVNRGDSFLNSLVDHRLSAAEVWARQKSTIQVPTVSLDEFCELAKFRPHAVKIDIEGAELLALQGSSSLLEERRATFIVAIHPSWLPHGQEAAEIFDLFRLHGYRVTASQTERYEGVDFGDYVFAPDRSAIH